VPLGYRADRDALELDRVNRILEAAPG
jgi:hypothetical protein